MRITGARKKIRIGDLLVEAGAITPEQLQEALAKQKEEGGMLGNIIMELGFISRELLITVLTTQMGIDYCEIRTVQIDENVLNLVPKELVTKYKAMPIGFSEENANVLQVAMADPMDLMAVDDISIASGLQVEPLLSFEDDIDNVIGKNYGSAEAMQAAEAYKLEMGVGADDEGNAFDEEIDNSPIVLLVNQIIEGGVRQRASDIHIEALETNVRVRYRIDGALKQVMTYELNILPAITARIKIIGGMDIAEKRKP
ncbi:MAG: ATPase, T2SS/T4P/T4SS family, partial [Eubacterium sp.]|nr:ATPase, T2SS/T4P/T4SS family [Eubacterium sp.]